MKPAYGLLCLGAMGALACVETKNAPPPPLVVDAAGPDDGPAPDAPKAAPDAGPDLPADGAGSPPDAGHDAAAPSPDAAPDTMRPPDTAPDAPPTPNRAFVTSQKYSTNLGGLAGADARCQQSAQGAGLTGTFVALVSTAAVPAFSRLGNSRGWVRLDGTPFADTQADLVAGRIYYPLAVEEHGRDEIGNDFVFTGTELGGNAGRTANDWGAPAADCRVSVGIAIDGSIAWYSALEQPCTFDAHLFCLEVGHSVAVPRPTPPAGARVAFLSRATWDPSSGLPAADTLCTGEAEAAKLPGSFRAFLATSTASAVSRFDLTGPPWVRPDGISVVAKASDLAAGRAMAPLQLGASGQLPPGIYSAWTGADAPDRPATINACSDWKSKDNSMAGVTGATRFSGRDWFSNGKLNCAAFDFTGIYCFQR